MILNPSSTESRKLLLSQIATLLAVVSVFGIGLAGCEKTTPEPEPPSVDSTVDPFAPEPASADAPDLSKMNEKLDTIIIPAMEFVDTPLPDALEFLQQRSVELDPSKEGINIIVKPGSLQDALLTLNLKQIPLRQALIYMAELSGGGITVEKYAVVLGYEKTPDSVANSADSQENIAAIQQKLETIIVPSVHLQDTPLSDALEFLQQMSVELDSAEANPQLKGINLILNMPSLNDQYPFGGGFDAGGGSAIDTPITLKLTNVPLGEALRYTCSLAGLEYQVGPNAVTISHPK
jgi:hypothetical protein